MKSKAYFSKLLQFVDQQVLVKAKLLNISQTHLAILLT